MERFYDFFFCNKVIVICFLMLIEILIKYLDDFLILFVLLCDKRKGRGLNCLYYYFILRFCFVLLYCLIFVFWELGGWNGFWFDFYCFNFDCC